ncbi:MAG: rhomboid family intramembrane serine protease [Anaerolineales bacterium]
MFPVSDEPRLKYGAAYITIGLVVLNILIFLYEVSLGSGVDVFINTYGAVPREILTGVDIAPPGPNPVYLQLLTSMFLHGGWLHLIGNMAYMRVFADDIEDLLGHGLFLVFYLGTGLVASMTHILLSGAADTIPSVGASGAIAGVLGAYLVLYPGRKVHVLVPYATFSTAQVSALILLGFWFLMQFFSGIAALSADTAQSGGVAVWAHIGGFVAGAVVGLLFRGRVRAPQARMS